MSDLFSLFHNITGRCLIKDVPMSEIIARKTSFFAHGGQAGLTTMREGLEFSKPAPRLAVPITTDEEGNPLEVGEVTQLSMPETGVAEVVMSPRATKEAADYILANCQAVGKKFAWSFVIAQASKGAQMSIKQIRYIKREYTLIREELELVEEMD